MMMQTKRVFKAISIALVTSALVTSAVAIPALASEARCYTDDDGTYPCWFEPIEGDGSFEISAPGKPTFTLYMNGNGTAQASAVFEPGGRSVPLPGPHVRSKKDGACWVSTATDTQICAW